MTLRAVAAIAKCSHGSVSLEKAVMKREEAQRKTQLVKEQTDGEMKTEAQEPQVVPSSAA
jgi:hypothetical protein